MTYLNSHFKAVGIGFIILLADLLTKFLIQHNLPLTSLHYAEYPYGGIAVFRDFAGIEFTIVHAINRGAAWGMFAEWQTVLLFIRFLIITGIVIYAFLNKKKEYDIPLALIVAGAFGNVVDFFLYGHVVDMFHFIFWGYEYPVFNLADSSIFIGIAWLLILSLFKDLKKNESSFNTH